MDSNAKDISYFSNSGSGFNYEKFESEENSSGEEPTDFKKEKKKKRMGEEAYDWVQCLVAALLFCVITFSFFFRIIGIIGPSMQPSFYNGDRVFISKLFYEPKNGDIIVLRKDTFQEEPIIKRVIALEGQTVDIDFSLGIVYVDGVAIDEPYIAEPTLTPLNFTGEVTVPEGHVFVLGDNRNHSADSRYESIGCVDERYIIGKVLFRVLPITKIGVVK